MTWLNLFINILTDFLAGTLMAFSDGRVPNCGIFLAEQKVPGLSRIDHDQQTQDLSIYRAWHTGKSHISYCWGRSSGGHHCGLTLQLPLAITGWLPSPPSSECLVRPPFPQLECLKDTAWHSWNVLRTQPGESHVWLRSPGLKT